MRSIPTNLLTNDINAMIFAILPTLFIINILPIFVPPPSLTVILQGDFSLVSVSELRGLAAALEGTDCNLVAVSTDSVEAHKVMVMVTVMIMIR